MKILFPGILFIFVTVISSIAQVADKAKDITPLLIGEKMPSGELISVENESESLTEVISRQRTVLIIYRGGWCPYCNLHLAAVGQVESDIIELGYQIIAISPDSPDDLKATIEKSNLNYRLYSDPGATLIKALGLAFIDEDSDLNPVPALFVVETDGTILFEYINPNYKKRIGENLLLDVLKHFKKKK